MAPHISPTPRALPAFPRRCVGSGDFLFVFSSFLFVALKPASPKPLTPKGARLLEKGGCGGLTRPTCGPERASEPVRPPACLPRRLRSSVRPPGKPAARSLMHPFQWCNGESGGEEGAPDLRSEARSASRAKFLLKWGGREGALEPNSAPHSAEMEKQPNTPTQSPDLAGGRGRVSEGAAAAGRGSRGVRGLCVAASLSYPFPCLCALPVCSLL